MAEIKNLSVKFGDEKVLDNFSAHIPDGSVTAISGPSGSGKTTLLSVILGLRKPLTGQVTGFGPVAAVFQEDRLLPFLTALKNITLAANCSEAAAEAALSQVGFDPEDKEKLASALSGGMARRVAIVRAMLADSHCIILDEPFKGLDELTREKVLSFVNEHRRGRSLLVVTHDPRDAADLQANNFIEIK